MDGSNQNLGADPFAGSPLIPYEELETLTLNQDPDNPRVARITFNRPEKLNAISFHTPSEIRRAVEVANDCDDIHVIVLQGAGPAFCAGYDITLFGEEMEDQPCKQESEPWDPMVDYRAMRRNTDDFMSLWRSHKPTIARVHKYAIAVPVAQILPFAVIKWLWRTLPG
jgi:enoyl-CoA hydratase/carnithine racemase